MSFSLGGRNRIEKVAKDSMYLLSVLPSLQLKRDGHYFFIAASDAAQRSITILTISFELEHF